ncbi:AT-rich interactive domain-containing protein 4A-like [Pseudophryne corroboree]|uniref:AT-rich interactive domain-containing protein 4A-like n=1 Tax=Pseudophryne corroboree TaxID=495146 RepID=UPI003081509A
MKMKKDSERKMKEKQKSRPQVKTTLQSDEDCVLSKTPSGEGKASSKHMTTSVPGNAALSNGLKGHKRISESNLGTLAKKQKRELKRMSASSKGEKNGIGQSSNRENLSALDTPSKCAPGKHIHVPKPQEMMRSPTTVTSPHIKQVRRDKHRKKHQHSTPRVYKWTLQLNELDNMSGTEKMEFLEDTLQEIRKQYMSLKAEVAAIDRKRIESQNKGRKVYNTRASMSSVFSWAGMGSSSSSHKALCL